MQVVCNLDLLFSNFNINPIVGTKNISFSQDIKKTPVKIPSQDSFTRQEKDNYAPYNVLSGFVNFSVESNFVFNNYLIYSVISDAVEKNPKIKEILAENGLEPKIYMENLIGNDRQHFLTTYKDAVRIAVARKVSDKDMINLKYAALLHDIGKGLIPSSIIHKKGSLLPEERKIVDLHAKLGAEILKTVNFPGSVDKDKVIEMVELHHTPLNPVLKDATPQEKRKNQNYLAQIITVADIHSALSEKRSYKEAWDNSIVEEILREKTQGNDFQQKCVDVVCRK